MEGNHAGFTGWTAIGGVSAWLLQFVFLGLMFSAAKSPFGFLGDIPYMLGAPNEDYTA